MCRAEKGDRTLLNDEKYRHLALVGLGASLALIAIGCDSISIQPSCPNELAVGSSGRVAANELNPGEIAVYQWEVFPTDAGSFDNATAPTTTFLAAKTGDALIRLTASDGLYQVVSACVTKIVGQAAVAVSLQANPTTAAVGEPITLTCTSTGTSVALGIVIEQDSGVQGTITEILIGTIEFRGAEAGQATLSCLGLDINAQSSAPSTVTVTITPGSNGNTNDNSGGGGRR